MAKQVEEASGPVADSDESLTRREGLRPGGEIGDFWQVLNTAAAKHKEVLAQLSERIDPNSKEEWQKAMGYSQLIYDKTAQELREEG